MRNFFLGKKSLFSLVIPICGSNFSGHLTVAMSEIAPFFKPDNPPLQVWAGFSFLRWPCQRRHCTEMFRRCPILCASSGAVVSLSMCLSFEVRAGSIFPLF